MNIEEIIELPKGRRKIVIDDGTTFILYRGELGGLNIEVNSELSKESYDRIMNEILPKRAKLRGLNLLKSRPYTEWQLRQKYIDGGYPEAVIDTAIDYIKEMHCIDDYEYCRTYITYRSKDRSRKRLYLDLVNKGVNKDTIERAMNSVIEDGDISGEEELIKRLMEKRHYNPEAAEYEERQKMIQYLYGKGFSMDLIRNLT